MKPTITLVTLLFITILLVSSCSSRYQYEKITEFGKIMVQNGKGELDTLEYSCLKCPTAFQSKVTFQPFFNILSEKAKKRLNNPYSFIPKKVSVYLDSTNSMHLRYYNRNDTIKSAYSGNAIYTCIGKNGYGAEMETEINLDFYLIDNLFQENEDQFLLDSLKFVDDGISRNLILSKSNDKEFIAVIPDKNRSLTVKTATIYQLGQGQ